MCGPSKSLVTNPQSEPEFCYLCLKPLTAPTNRDHIPALQFFAPGIRERYNLSELLTVEVHQQCNSSYERDEQYLVYTLLGFMRGSEAGDKLYKHILNKYRSGEAVGLIKKVLAEFESQPGGIVLPGNRVLKRFDGERIRALLGRS